VTPLKTSLAGLIALAGFSPFAPAQADVGSETAELLNLMYQDTRQDCGAPSRPAFLCSGVLLRGTTPSTAYQFYSISPNNKTRGGVSASYLRKDAKFKQLAYGYKSGFIFDTVLDNPADHVDYKVLCAFAIDAATDYRTQNGCGDSSRTTAKENFCDQMGITTAEQWLTLYRKAGESHSQQCAFDVGQGRGLTANAFYQSLRAMALIGSESFNEDNEVILAPWTIDVPRSPSILASFYVDDSGVEGARLSQIQWYTASKSTQVLPAIQMKLPQTPAEDAKFIYDEMSQAIYPTTEADQCTSFTGGVKWATYTDARLGGRKVNSMQVTLNDCTRKLSDAQLNNFVNKLVSTQYLKPEWSADPKVGRNSVASVRQQLQCYLATARNLAVWGVEPSRPYLTKEKTLANGCNNF